MVWSRENCLQIYKPDFIYALKGFIRHVPARSRNPVMMKRTELPSYLEGRIDDSVAGPGLRVLGQRAVHRVHADPLLSCST